MQAKPLRRTPRLLRDVARDTRGATMVEYSLLLCLVLMAAAPVLGSVGRQVKTSFQAAAAVFEP